METASRGIPDQEMFLSRPAPEDGGDSPTVEPLRIFKPTSPQPNSRTSSASNSKPAFPLPPGASSSAAPLPFPDDDDVHRPTPAKPYGAAYNDTAPRLDTSPTDRRPGLAERRGAAPKVIHSPSSPDSDQGLFARPLKEQARPAAQPSVYSNYQNKTYYPPPGAAASSSSASSSSLPQPAAVNHLKQADPAVNRFPSTASNSTTKATRGSPPPPETPIVEPGVIPGGGIEARYAASGISGTATLTSLQASQAQSAAAAQRLAQYGNQAPQPQRPWTPTETPDQAPSGPPTVYQGSNVISSPQPQRTQTAPPPQPTQAQGNQSNQQVQVSVLEQDFQRLGTSSPPPAYSSVNPGGNSQYPNEKRRPQQNGPVRPAAAAAQLSQTNGAASSQKPAASSSAAAAAAAAGPANGAPMLSPALQHPGHPAFANDPRPEQNGVPPQNGPAPDTQTIGPWTSFTTATSRRMDCPSRSKLGSILLYPCCKSGYAMGVSQGPKSDSVRTNASIPNSFNIRKSAHVSCVRQTKPSLADVSSPYPRLCREYNERGGFPSPHCWFHWPSSLCWCGHVSSSANKWRLLWAIPALRQHGHRKGHLAWQHTDCYGFASTAYHSHPPQR